MGHGSLFYNVYGKRIIEVGALGSPDSYEEPFHQLDLSAKQELGGGLSLGFNAKNLLNPVARETQGSGTWFRWRKGRAFSLKLAMSFKSVRKKLSKKTGANVCRFWKSC